MDQIRQERWTELIKRLAATFIERESNHDALISVTRVDLTERLGHAIIYISVLPENKEQASLYFFTRNLGELRNYIKKHAPGRVLPHLSVEIDMGEKNRQRIDQIKIPK
jgi:ribosome-binding factor A